jgi:hypothetical protein
VKINQFKIITPTTTKFIYYYNILLDPVALALNHSHTHTHKHANIFTLDLYFQTITKATNTNNNKINQHQQSKCNTDKYYIVVISIKPTITHNKHSFCFWLWNRSVLFSAPLRTIRNLNLKIARKPQPIQHSGHFHLKCFPLLEVDLHQFVYA